MLVFYNDSNATDSRSTRLEISTICTKSRLLSKISSFKTSLVISSKELSKTLIASCGWHTSRNIFEMGVRRAIKLLEQGTSVQRAPSAEERWVAGVTGMEAKLDPVLPTLYNGSVENDEQEPNIAHDLCKRGSIKMPVSPPAGSPQSTSMDSQYSFRPHQDLSRGRPQEAAMDTLSTDHRKILEVYFGGLEPELGHCHQNDFGGYQPNPTAEAAASGGNQFDSNPAKSKFEHP
jgi:hypothetical protein